MTTFLESNSNNAKLNRGDMAYSKVPEETPLRKSIGCFKSLTLLAFTVAICLVVYWFLTAAPFAQSHPAAGLPRQIEKKQLLLNDQTAKANFAEVILSDRESVANEIKYRELTEVTKNMSTEYIVESLGATHTNTDRYFEKYNRDWQKSLNKNAMGLYNYVTMQRWVRYSQEIDGPKKPKYSVRKRMFEEELILGNQKDEKTTLNLDQVKLIYNDVTGKQMNYIDINGKHHYLDQKLQILWLKLLTPSTSIVAAPKDPEQQFVNIFRDFSNRDLTDEEYKIQALVISKDWAMTWFQIQNVDPQDHTLGSDKNIEEFHKKDTAVFRKEFFEKQDQFARDFYNYRIGQKLELGLKEDGHLTAHGIASVLRDIKVKQMNYAKKPEKEQFNKDNIGGLETNLGSDLTPITDTEKKFASIFTTWSKSLKKELDKYLAAIDIDFYFKIISGESDQKDEKAFGIENDDFIRKLYWAYQSNNKSQQLSEEQFRLIQGDVKDKQREFKVPYVFTKENIEKLRPYMKNLRLWLLSTGKVFNASTSK